MTRSSFLLTVGLIAPVLIAGCELSVDGTNNSSLGDNDYYEEPISERSEKYATALDISNKFIEFLVDGQLTNAHGLFDSRRQEVLSIEDFEKTYREILSDFGPFVEYKPMQWGFSTNLKLENIVVSIKIVGHEKSETFYVLNFEDNGIYDRIIGFSITARSEGERVAQAADRAHGR
jgi:hypothetical protein